jgi:hypothetical protein
MYSDSRITQNRSTQARGRENRTQSIATRFTRAEEQVLRTRAAVNGQKLREWAREVLLRGEAGPRRDDMEMHIFTELVGIQMLLMNTLEPLLRGDRIEPDRVSILFRQVQMTKAAKAQELLAKRSQKPEK